MTASIWNPGSTIIEPVANGTGTIVETSTLAEGQTIVNITKFNYTLGVDCLQVYINGAAINVGSDYTETSISSITLATPAQLGDTCKIVGTVNITNIVASSAPQTLGGTTIGDFSIDQSTPNGRVLISSTNPAGWNSGAGRMTLEFNMISNSFFVANPAAHLAFVLRQDPYIIATAVRGQGVAFGNATGFSRPSTLNPTPMLETWYNGFGAGNYLWSESEAARSVPPADGVNYKFIIDSIKTNEGNRYLRYRMWSLQSGAWRAEVDTGDVLDHNVWADLTQTAAVFGFVFESNLVPWSIDFTAIKITWGPAESSTPDVTTKLSRFGAQLSGDLNFIGTTRRISAPANAGPSLANSLTYQTSSANSVTTMVTKPSGTATTANSLYSNNSSSTTTYQAVTFGISGTTGLVETFHLGVSDPVFGVNIGASNRIATFKSTGLNILGGSKDIGQTIGLSPTLLNWGGSNQTAYATGASIDWELASGVGYISSFIGASYNQVLLENTIRPLWCVLGFLIKNLQDKKVI